MHRISTVNVACHVSPCPSCQCQTCTPSCPLPLALQLPIIGVSTGSCRGLIRVGILPPLPGRDGHLHSLPHAVEDTQLPSLAYPHMGGEDSPPSCPLLLCRTICQPLFWPACAPTLAKRKGTLCQASLRMIHIDVARCNPAGNLAEQADAVRANGLVS